ncbi:Cytochrome c [Novosphingobium resinovorum]|jgi:cytochrome c556|uniref:Cytochrome c n=1 Tax=Novosphingobium resinovorum TaxID=158500 RepID=A0A031K721_9SPHN|nr:cytochrome c [Novosphingobium resinovorum]EZP84377.1 Cytochrome c [Novosphingobium resinovorum]
MTLSNKLSLAVLGVSAAVLTVSATVAIAASPAETAITTRHANFKKMGGAMKVLKDQLASGSIDKAQAVAAAKTLATTGRAQVGLFPNGSGPSSGVKTEALPAIWTNRAAFDGAMKTYISQADKLVAVAGTGNAAAIGAQFKAVGGACGSCHKQFRADD